MVLYCSSLCWDDCHYGNPNWSQKMLIFSAFLPLMPLPFTTGLDIFWISKIIWFPNIYRNGSNKRTWRHIFWKYYHQKSKAKELKNIFFENIIIKIQNQSFISAIMSSHCAISPHLLCALSTANQFQKHHLLETPLHSDLFVRISLKK